MNSRIIYGPYSMVHPKNHENEQEEDTPLFSKENQNSVIALTENELLLLKSWQVFISRQIDDVFNEVPHLKLRMEWYSKNKWSINQAWKDFSKIITQNADEIFFQAGKNGFNIPNFSVHLMNYEIFRRLFIASIPESERSKYEIFGISHRVPKRVNILMSEMLGTPAKPTPLLGIASEKPITTTPIPLPSSQILEKKGEPILGSSIKNLVNTGDFQTDMPQYFEKIGLISLGENTLEKTLIGAFEEYIILHIIAANPGNIIWYKNLSNTITDTEDHLHYELVLQTTQTMGEYLKYLLTSMRERRKIAYFIQKKLGENQIQPPKYHFHQLEIDFQIWTPQFGIDKPWYFTRNGIGLKVLRTKK